MLYLNIIKTNKMKYSLNCPYFTESFDSISELLTFVITSGVDPNYEITVNGTLTDELASELLQF